MGKTPDCTNMGALRAHVPPALSGAGCHVCIQTNKPPYPNFLEAQDPKDLRGGSSAASASAAAAAFPWHFASTELINILDKNGQNDFKICLSHPLH